MNYAYPNQMSSAAMAGQPQMPFPQAPVATQSQPTIQMPQQNIQMQSFFPQPIGNVYNLNTSSDINNIPTGAGVSIGLCLNENIVYIKGSQNGSPMLLGYTLAPIDGAPSNPNTKSSQSSINTETPEEKEIIRKHVQKIKSI